MRARLSISLVTQSSCGQTPIERARAHLRARGPHGRRVHAGRSTTTATADPRRPGDARPVRARRRRARTSRNAQVPPDRRRHADAPRRARGRRSHRGRRSSTRAARSRAQLLARRAEPDGRRRHARRADGLRHRGRGEQAGDLRHPVDAHARRLAEPRRAVAGRRSRRRSRAGRRARLPQAPGRMVVVPTGAVPPTAADAGVTQGYEIVVRAAGQRRRRAGARGRDRRRPRSTTAPSPGSLSPCPIKSLIHLDENLRRCRRGRRVRRGRTGCLTSTAASTSSRTTAAAPTQACSAVDQLPAAALVVPLARAPAGADADAADASTLSAETGGQPHALGIATDGRFVWVADLGDAVRPRRSTRRSRARRARSRRSSRRASSTRRASSRRASSPSARRRATTSATSTRSTPRWGTA